MVSSEEIRRRLDAKRRGIDVKTEYRTEKINLKKEGETCPSCHTQNPSTAKYCVGCGEKLEKNLQPENIAPTQKPDSEIKAPEENMPTKEEDDHRKEKKYRITPRPDDFTKTGKQGVTITNRTPESSVMEPSPTSSNKIEPIVPKTPESPLAKTSELPKTKTPEPTATKTPEPIVKTLKPQIRSDEPVTKTPEPPAKGEDEPKVDPVERIKKAKELLDIGAITQEDFDKIKNKYLDEI